MNVLDKNYTDEDAELAQEQDEEGWGRNLHRNCRNLYWFYYP